MNRRRAFSTLGCPAATLEEVVALASESGWDAVELRSAPGSPVHVELTRAERTRARRLLASVGRVCLASYLRLGDPEADDEDVVARLRQESELARDLGFPAVRVFPGGHDDGAIARRVRAACDELRTDIWIETHDSHRTGAALARLLDTIGDERIGAVWDVAHPWADGEPIRVTARALAPHLRHVQLKDLRSPDDPRPVLPGTGALPIGEVIGRLDELGYAGALSLEWELLWHPELPPLPEALHAAQLWLQDAAAANA